MHKYLFIILLLCTYSAQGQDNNSHDFDGAYDGQHSLTFTPFSGVVTYEKFNPGVGFDYEFTFAKKAGISVRFPFVWGYEGPEQRDLYYGGSYTKHNVVFAAPSIRFHAPFGGDKSGEFVTGLGMLIGNMHFREYDEYNGIQRSYDYSLTGPVIDNSLNFYRRHFLFGIDVRTGYMFEVRDDSRFFINFGIHFGGKF